MKRFLALVMLLCCLLLMLPTVFAEPAEDEPEEVLTEDGEPAEDEEEAPEDSEEEKDAEKEEEDEPVEPVDPLAGETAMRRVEILCVVNEKGEVDVTQTIEMSIVGEVEEIRIAVPEEAKKREISGFRVKNEVEDGIRYLIVSEKSGFSGSETFKVSYTLENVVTQAEESQKLELPLLMGQDYRVGGISLSVNMPKAFTTFPSFFSGYYGELIEDYMNYEAEESVVTGVVDTILQDSDSLSMTLTVPDGYFAGNFGKGAATTVLTIVAAVLTLLAVLFWWRTLRNSAMRVQARTLPPDGVNPGDLPFLLAGGSADFNMLVSYWATLGYVSFYVNKGGHVILRRRMSMGNERRTFERKLFDLLFGEDNLCDGASMRYKRVGERAQAVIPRYWGKRLYEKSSGSPFFAKLLLALAGALVMVAAMDALAPVRAHGLFLVMGFVAGAVLYWLATGIFGAFYLSDYVRMGIGIAAGLLVLILGSLGDAMGITLLTMAEAVLLGRQTAHGGRRSPYGDQIIGQTMGFRRFLLHANESHMLQMLRRDPQYFYKMLPYAQAMGQGKRFVSLFRDAQLEPCQWYESARGTPTRAGAFYERYLDMLDMLNISLKK